MYCFVSRLQTQARLSYHALLIWQSEQEAGGEHKYCLGWLLKTRDKPLIHGVLFLWKSPGGSCISSTFSPQVSVCALPSLSSPVCCNICVMVAWKETHTHLWKCKQICQTWAFWLFCRDATYSSQQNGKGNHSFSPLVWDYTCHSAVWQTHAGRLFTATDNSIISL